MNILASQKLLRWLTASIVIGFYIVGFWPFNFRQGNRVRWSSGSPGLHFERFALAYGLNPLVLKPSVAGAAGRTGVMSVEMWLEADSETDRDVPRILSLYDGNLPENLIVAQWKSSVLIRAAIQDPGGSRRYREVGVQAGLRKGEMRLIAITADDTGTAFYTGAGLVRRFPKWTISPDIVRGRLILGNSATGAGGTWKGTLRGLAFFSRAVSAAEIADHYQAWSASYAQRLVGTSGLAALYLFDEGSGSWIEDRTGRQAALFIPPRFFILHKQILSAARHDFLPNRSNMDDVVINVLGFIPFGFFFFLWRDRARARRAFLNAALTVLTGAAISLSIEVVQVALPSRDSSLRDAVCNILGTLTGMLPALWISLRPRAEKISQPLRG